MSTRVGIEREKGNTSASVRNGEACLSLSLCEGPNMARHGEREREGERRRELGLVGEEKSHDLFTVFVSHCPRASSRASPRRHQCPHGRLKSHRLQVAPMRPPVPAAARMSSRASEHRINVLAARSRRSKRRTRCPRFPVPATAMSKTHPAATRLPQRIVPLTMRWQSGRLFLITVHAWRKKEGRDERTKQPQHSAHASRRAALAADTRRQ